MVIRHGVLKVSEIVVYFDSVRRKYFYFDYEQLVIGWRGHVTLHMRRSIVHNQNKRQIPGKRDKYRVAYIMVGGHYIFFRREASSAGDYYVGVCLTSL